MLRFGFQVPFLLMQHQQKRTRMNTNNGKANLTNNKPLATPIGDDFLELAKWFREIQDEAPERFALEAKSSGVGLRKAYALAQIDRRIRPLDIGRELLGRIGWTKLQVVSNHINVKNFKELLALAESSSAHELAMTMRNQKPLAGTRCVALYLCPKQYKIFAAAVLANGGKKSGRGLIDKEEALTRALTSSCST
ncbi:hypothetical protein [Hyphomicrobium sp.]|uniref:hypothetical protein n=1 Tax=Hyphomicrobium sp. TaxID=82 RepID=UPI001D2ADBB4|nr:hypothetical protein [Hyphomicrobium sp.]MBY0560133.1 hypothetical protein [Hyphomicrobium sp.]